MVMSVSADPTFGLNPQSVAVMHLLTGQYISLDEPPKTFPWYNGSENGIALVVSNGCSFRVIVVGEDGRSDRVFVEHWDSKTQPFNVPTVDQREASGATVFRSTFKASEISKAADAAFCLMQNFVGGI